MILRLSLLLLIFGVVTGCVPVSKLVPLQSGDLHVKNMPLDTVVRTRPLALKEYRIQPQDQLSIMVETLTPDEFNFLKQLNPNMSRMGGNMGGNMGGGGIGYYVDARGNVEMPVLGPVHLSGLTLLEAEHHLRLALKDLLRDPVVRVRILNFRFVFAGEVNGLVVSPSPRISIMEALAQVGGLTELSDRSNIKIIRQKGDSAEVLYVNVLDEKIISSPNFWLQQNDIVIVSPLRQRTARTYLTQNIGLFVSLITLGLTTINFLTR